AIPVGELRSAQLVPHTVSVYADWPPRGPALTTHRVRLRRRSVWLHHLNPFLQIRAHLGRFSCPHCDDVARVERELPQRDIGPGMLLCSQRAEGLDPIP